MLEGQELLADITEKLRVDPNVRSVVLFGSRARPAGAFGPDRWSDIDLHLIVDSPSRMVESGWASGLGTDLHLQVARRVPGGVGKITLLFGAGEATLILLPLWPLRAVRLGMKFGLPQRLRPIRLALNEMATVLRAGYQFLKGEKQWGRFYAQVVTGMPGRRLDDAEAAKLAEAFLIEMHGLLARLGRGELVEAQRMLHKHLMECNLALIEEARLRQGLVTFGSARRVESLLSLAELPRVKISARLNQEELRAAARQAHAGMIHIMAELVPAWKPPIDF